MSSSASLTCGSHTIEHTALRLRPGGCLRFGPVHQITQMYMGVTFITTLSLDHRNIGIIIFDSPCPNHHFGIFVFGDAFSVR